jgi:hypothetical protein
VRHVLHHHPGLDLLGHAEAMALPGVRHFLCHLYGRRARLEAVVPPFLDFERVRPYHLGEPATNDGLMWWLRRDLDDWVAACGRVV